MDSLKTKRIEHVLRQDIIREIGVAIGNLFDYFDSLLIVFFFRCAQSENR